MTNNEILQANLLDILFEHRNKAYGAYALRKNYNHRLGWALGISLGATLIATLTLHEKTISNPTFFEHPLVTLPTYSAQQKTQQPEKRRSKIEPRRAQRQYTSQIALVKDNVKPNMRDVHEVQTAQISTRTIEGLLTSGASSELTGIGNSDNVKAIVASTQPEPILSSSEAQFPGGVESFKKFLTKNLVTPDELQVDEKKMVLVRFKVDIDGSISSVQILQSGGERCDAEVLRVLNKMPKWVPATQNGVKVATWFTQPVSFIGVE